MMMRLDAMLSRFGYCSRREAALWIKDGRVLVQGAVPRSADVKARAADVLIDGVPLDYPDGVLLAFHKPAGVTCSHDPAEAPLLYDLLPPLWMKRDPRVEAAGRLDKETSGLILLTDDGPLLHRLTSPKHHVEKVYEATVETDLPPGIADVFASGTLMLRSETTPCLPAKLKIRSAQEASLTITEGRYHQVRRMFASQGCHVMKLHRTRIGRVELGDLAEGAWREISRDLLT